jgi:hypothetical protein
MSIVKHDLFPAYVAILPRGDDTPNRDMTASPLFPRHALQIQKARIIVFDDYVIIVTDSDNGAHVVLEEAIQPDTYLKTATHSYVVTKTGAKITYTKDTNCGCGSRLKSWNPYTTLSA